MTMFDFDAYGEGVNGNYYSEELDFGGEYDSVRTSSVKKRYTRRTASFSKDPLYYHVELFKNKEAHSIVRETDGAILYAVDAGEFWVPKALIKRGKYVHKSFKRKYI